LEEATSRYRDAVKLAKEIEKDLDELKNEITVLAEDFSK
jgi:exonuclease VII small subunit